MTAVRFAEEADRANRAHDGQPTKPVKTALSLVILSIALFITVAATTAVSVALPSMGAELGIGESGEQWIFETFVLVSASLLMAGGALGDRVGRKGLFLTGAAFFGVGSVVGGLAPNLPVLIVGRALQGVGPALLVTSSLTIIRAMYTDPARRAAAIGLWSTSSGLAIALGPVIGGLLTDSLGWRWVLLINTPVIAVLFVLAAIALPKLPTTRVSTRFDIAGAALTVVAVAALAYGLTEAPSRGWTAVPVMLAGLGFVVAGGLFLWWELRTADPLVDLRLFRSPTYTAANVAGMVVFLAFIGAIVYFSIYFQRVQGRSPVETGLALLPIGVAFAVGSSVSGRLVSRVGPLSLMLIGLVMAGAGMLSLAWLQVETPLADIWWRFAVAGFGVGLSLTPMTTIAVAAVGADRAGMASAIHTAMRQIGQLLGVAVLGAIVYDRGSSGGSLSPSGRSDLVAGLQHAVVFSSVALWTIGGLVAILFAVDAHRTKFDRQPAASLANGK